MRVYDEKTKPNRHAYLIKKNNRKNLLFKQRLILLLTFCCTLIAVGPFIALVRAECRSNTINIVVRLSASHHTPTSQRTGQISDRHSFNDCHFIPFDNYKFKCRRIPAIAPFAAPAVFLTLCR